METAGLLQLPGISQAQAGKRIEWIDYAKVFALYLMVVGHHVAALSPGVSQWIYSFHMPLFFFYSGVFYKARSFKETLHKDFKALIIPFLILNAVCLAFSLAYSHFHDHLPFPDAIRLAKIIGVSLIGMGATLEEGVRPVCVYLWFFIALFAIHLLASLGHRRINTWMVGVSVLCVVYVANLMQPMGYNTPFSALMAFPLFSAGYFAKGLRKVNIHWAWGLLAIVAAATPHYYLSQLNGRADINGLSYGNNFAVYYFTALLGIIMATGVAVLLRQVSGRRLSRCMSDLAIGGVVVVGLQDVLLLASNKGLALVGNSLTYTDLQVFVASIAVMAVFVAVIRGCKRWVPAVLGGRR